MKKLTSVLLITALIAVFFQCCKKTTDNAPSLPPANSMTIDFSNFTAKKKAMDISNQGTNTLTNVNWFLASTTAGFWNLILTINLVVPVAAFKAAVDNKPVLLSDKKWQWSYVANAVGATYNARLTGEIRTSDVKWEMYISKTGVGQFAE